LNLVSVTVSEQTTPDGRLTSDVENYPGIYNYNKDEHGSTAAIMILYGRNDWLFCGRSVNTLAPTAALSAWKVEFCRPAGDSGRRNLSEAVIIATGGQRPLASLPSGKIQNYGVSACAACVCLRTKT